MILNSLKLGIAFVNAASLKRNANSYGLAVQISSGEVALGPVVCHKRAVWSNSKIKRRSRG